MSTFDEMRAELLKDMDKYCNKKKITRDELLNQISKLEQKQPKVKVTKMKNFIIE